MIVILSFVHFGEKFAPGLLRLLECILHLFPLLDVKHSLREREKCVNFACYLTLSTLSIFTFFGLKERGKPVCY